MNNLMNIYQKVNQSFRIICPSPLEGEGGGEGARRRNGFSPHHPISPSPILSFLAGEGGVRVKHRRLQSLKQNISGDNLRKEFNSSKKDYKNSEGVRILRDVFPLVKI